MAYKQSIPKVYDVGSTIKILCADDISQDILSPCVVVSKVFAGSQTTTFTNSCTVALESNDRPLVLKAMDPRYSIRFRRGLGLPVTFDSDAFYRILESPHLATIAKRITSNASAIWAGMRDISDGSASLDCDESQRPLIENTSTCSGLLEFMSLFTTTRERKQLSTKKRLQTDMVNLDGDLNIATIVCHPGLSELAACLIMEYDFDRQYTKWSALTAAAAKGVSTLLTTCIVYTMSDDGNYVYFCGGLITLEVPGSTGRMLGTALAQVAQNPERLEYCIHEFESFLLTISYFNLSLRDLRADNLVLDTSSSKSHRLVLIDAGTVEDDTDDKQMGIYRNSQEEHARRLIRKLLGVTSPQLLEAYGHSDWETLKRVVTPSRVLDWHIIISDVTFFWSPKEGVDMAPYIAIMSRIAQVILLQGQFPHSDPKWPIPQLQELQRVISFHDDQTPSPTVPIDIAHNLATIKHRLDQTARTSQMINILLLTQRVLDHHVWQREAKSIHQMSGAIGESAFEEWVSRKFDALHTVTGIHLTRQHIVVEREPQQTSSDTLEYGG